MRVLSRPLFRGSTRRRRFGVRREGAAMNEIKFGLGPNVRICAAAGSVLGLVLALWGVGGGTENIGIVVATVIVFTILSGIFGMFV
jgi:hypothetical protein